MYSVDEVVAAMRTQPWGITEPQGRTLFAFLLSEKPAKILELGCGIGTSALYMSAAMEHYGGSGILSIDRNPDLPEHVRKTFAKLDPALSRFHRLTISPTSYNDELMTLIQRQTRDGKCEPCFDFCFIDGAHTWEVDGCAFFMAEKLLKPGGWLLFDDLTWTVGGSAEALRHGMGKDLTPEMLQTPQVMRVFELCVAQHPGFDSFTITDDWAWTRKRSGPPNDAPPPQIARFYQNRRGPLGGLRSLAKRALRMANIPRAVA